MNSKNKNLNSHKIFFLLLALTMICGLLTANANAASPTPGAGAGVGYGADEAAGKAGLLGSSGSIGIPEFLGSFAGAALALSGSIFLFLIIYGGIIIMTAAGDTTKIKKGKDIIVWAIIGVLILGSAYALTTFVFSLFKQ